MKIHKIGFGLIIVGLTLAIIGAMATKRVILLSSNHGEWGWMTLFIGFGLLMAGNGLISLYRVFILRKS